MKGSLEHKMDILPSIEIDTNEQFVLKVKGREIKLMIGISTLEYQLGSGKSSITLQIYNPNPIGIGYQITEYEIGK